MKTDISHSSDHRAGHNNPARLNFSDERTAYRCCSIIAAAIGMKRYQIVLRYTQENSGKDRNQEQAAIMPIKTTKLLISTVSKVKILKKLKSTIGS